MGRLNFYYFKFVIKSRDVAYAPNLISSSHYFKKPKTFNFSITKIFIKINYKNSSNANIINILTDFVLEEESEEGVDRY